MSSLLPPNGLTPSSKVNSRPPRPTSREDTQCTPLRGASLWIRGSSIPWDSLRNRALLVGLKLELCFSQLVCSVLFEGLGEPSTWDLLSFPLDMAFAL